MLLLLVVMKLSKEDAANMQEEWVVFKNMT